MRAAVTREHARQELMSERDAPERHADDVRPSPNAGRVAALLLGVAAAYYLGARIGFVLRFPPATTSVLWPPNALLTAALLLVPPRRFWLVILAALPAHILVQAQAGFPPLLIASLFATNCLEALLAAAAVHRWSDDPTRFDSLSRVLVFVAGAVIMAPVVSSFADAAAVYFVRGEAYGLVVVRRLFSNMLSQLTIVPAVVMLVRQGSAWLHTTTQRRGAEVVLLAVGMIGLGGLVFTGYHHSPLTVLGGPFIALPFLLPLLIFPAVRFGPPGASFSLLACALLASGIAVSGAELPTARPAEERVRALQVFLVLVGIPLLFLSALVEERRQALAAVKERLRFEELVSEISGAFVHVPSHEMPEVFETWLERLARFMGLDRAALWEFTGPKHAMASVAWWSRPEAGPPPRLLEAATLTPRIVEHLLHQQPFVCADADATTTVDDREYLTWFGVRSLLALPLVAGGEVLGCLALVSVTDSRDWPDSEVQGARLVAEVFASALARQRGEDALRASETMKSAVLASLTSRVAVLDRTGRIIAVNESWSHFARENEWAQGEAAGVDTNYLEVCRVAAEAGGRDAPDARAGIQGVLDGWLASFGYDYTQSTRAGDRWFHLMVVPLNRPEGGAVVSHADVTERRRAEMMAQKSRDELAHFLRVSTIGELTTSIAHELNQPLTAIVANAQAARRLMAAAGPPGPVGEVDEILTEISSEARRAGEVIRGLRLLLRKGEHEQAELDVNVLVDDVSRLLANDVMIRGVTLRHELTRERLLTLGDRVQLQQVLLNLLINAMEAMSEVRGERVIAVRTESAEAGMARVSVADTGPGLAAGREDEVFKPFYSTKAHGMGMGLSIARSILEAHGGTISAEHGAHSGATFTFTLPLVGGRP
jgi:signal transduction histidine kinase/integral membrane sensor domain MASE1